MADTKTISIASIIMVLLSGGTAITVDLTNNKLVPLSNGQEIVFDNQDEFDDLTEEAIAIKIKSIVVWDQVDSKTDNEKQFIREIAGVTEFAKNEDYKTWRDAMLNKKSGETTWNDIPILAKIFNYEMREKKMHSYTLEELQQDRKELMKQKIEAIEVVKTSTRGLIENVYAINFIP